MTNSEQICIIKRCYVQVGKGGIMEKSISNAFTYMFKDSDWKYKLFVMLMFMSPPYILQGILPQLSTMIKTPANSSIGFIIALAVVLIVVTIIFFLTLSGYSIKCANNIIYSNEDSSYDSLLPKWEDDFGQFLKLGLKYVAAILLLMFAFLGVGLLGGIIAGIFKMLPIISVLMAIAAVIAGLGLTYLALALHSIFYSNYGITSYFQFDKAIKLISYNPKRYLQIFAIYFGTAIISSLINQSIMKSYLIVIMPIIQVYMMLVWTYLIAIIFPAEPEVFFATD